MSRHPDETELAALVLGELGRKRQAVLEPHLRGCAQCRATVARLREVVAVSDRLAGRGVTEEELGRAHGVLLEKVRANAIPGERPGRRQWRLLLRWLVPSLGAVAVCVAVALVLVVPQGPGQVVMADVRHALRQVPWVHVTGTARSTLPGQAEPREARFELWFGFGPRRMADRYSFLDGEVVKLDSARLWDAGESRKYWYRPKTDTVLVQYFDGSYGRVDSPLAAVAWLLGEGPMATFDELKRAREVRQGREVDVLTFERVPVPLWDTDLDSRQLVVACDLETKLPLEVSTIGRRDGQVVLEAGGTVDYPAAGPTSIYDLGVPRTAKVDNYLPETDVMALQDSIDAHLERFGPVYDAVLYARHVSGIVKNPPSDESFLFCVRRDHGRLRLDVYDLFAPGEDQTLDAPDPDDLDAIKAWMTPERFYWSLLVDENWVHKRGRWGDRAGKLLKAPRSAQFRPQDNLLTELMWPRTARFRHRSVRLRSLGGGEGLPCLESGGDRFLINPERDCIAERYEREQRGNLLWVRTVQQYAQTDVGYWYPTVVREQWHITTEAGARQRQGPEGFWYVHLETPDSIPDEVFGPDSLGPGKAE